MTIAHLTSSIAFQSPDALRPHPRNARTHPKRQIKQVADTKVGDTITDERKGTAQALPGFKSAQQVVFCGLFPVDAAQFEDLRDALREGVAAAHMA